MGLIETAKNDIAAITTNSNEWAVELTFYPPAGASATIKGLHTKHHQGVDTEGLRVNSLQAHISFSEQVLVAEGYTVRNANGDVDIKNHRVAVKDSTGVVKNYIIREVYPDETIGLIVCILGDYES